MPYDGLLLETVKGDSVESICKYLQGAGVRIDPHDVVASNKAEVRSKILCFQPGIPFSMSWG